MDLSPYTRCIRRKNLHQAQDIPQALVPASIPAFEKRAGQSHIRSGGKRSAVCTAAL
ncbi:hypothetical protein HMPREF1986_01258 [Oribacterium sp. oral taxon 078 str. F0263]|nr:hypothetical protein HMPREF1986_01258 [Oribacterium sp. oral taxon 078 str. F0263]